MILVINLKINKIILIIINKYIWILKDANVANQNVKKNIVNVFKMEINAHKNVNAKIVEIIIKNKWIYDIK
jgi:hypothetical protein